MTGPAEKLRPGAVYDVTHRRKGRFRVQVVKDDGDWVECILDSLQPFMASGDRVVPGDTMTLRRSFCEFTLVE